MEGHSMPIGAELGAETLRPVNFLEAYADKEATLFGITATLSELKGMCPVDLSDPSKLDMVNTFVVKVANEAGWEIQPEHAPAFAQIAETNRMERKFTVAAKTDQNPAEVPKPSDPQDTHLTPKESSTAPVAAKAHTPSEVSSKPEVHKAILHFAEPRLLQDPQDRLQHQLRAEQNEPETAPPSLRIKTKVHKNSVSTDFPDGLKTAKTARTAITAHIKLTPPTPSMAIKAEAASLVFPNEPEPEIENSIGSTTLDQTKEQVLPLVDEVEGHVLYASESIPPLTDVELLPVTEINLMSKPSAASAWEGELGKEPEQLYDNLALNLENFTQTMAEHQDSESGEPPGMDILLPAPEKAVQIAAIVSMVSERLQTVNDKDHAMSHVTNIVGVVHGIHVLTERNADPGHIAFARLQLEAFTSMLFQELSIEPDKENIKLFIEALLSPEFTPKQQPRDAVGITEAGTYETKVLPGRPHNHLQIIEQRAHRLLGQIAVFYAHMLQTLYIDEATIASATSA